MYAKSDMTFIVWMKNNRVLDRQSAAPVTTDPTAIPRIIFKKLYPKRITVECKINSITTNNYLHLYVMLFEIHTLCTYNG